MWQGAIFSNPLSLAFLLQKREVSKRKYGKEAVKAKELYFQRPRARSATRAQMGS